MIDLLELLNIVWKRPVCQFWKDDLNLRYCLGWIDEESYHIEKQKLEQTIYEYNCCKQTPLFVL